MIVHELIDAYDDVRRTSRRIPPEGFMPGLSRAQRLATWRTHRQLMRLRLRRLMLMLFGN
jgi:hypothetical protein